MRLATSLAHLGANVTGCSSRAADLEAKRLQLLKELVPGLSRVAILFNYTNQFTIENKLPSVYTFRESPYGGLRCHTQHRSGLRISSVSTSRPSVRAAASDFPEYVEAGGLMSYGPNFPDLFRRGAGYVDKILRGESQAK